MIILKMKMVPSTELALLREREREREGDRGVSVLSDLSVYCASVYHHKEVHDFPGFYKPTWSGSLGAHNCDELHLGNINGRQRVMKN